ncbi:MAG: PTS sugar transporter subunit IIC [Candidatus Velthaea sp.]
MLPSSAGSKQSSADSNAERSDLSPFFGWLERKVEPYAQRFGEAPAILALRDALPFSFGGLIAGLIGFLLFAEHGSVVERFRHAFSSGRLVLTLDVGFTTMSLVLVCALAVVLSRRVRYPALLSIPTTLGVFALSMPHPRAAKIEDYALALGASGLFLAIVVSLMTAGALSIARARLGARYIWAGAVGIIAVAYGAFELHLSLAKALGALIEPLGTLGDTYTALLVIALLQAGLWLVGIHGPALLAAVVTPIYLKLQFANTAAYSHGDVLPHIVVVSTFLFVFPGGAGATLPLALLLLRSKSSRLKKIAYASIGPSLINTNEPLLLGVPLIFNPYLAIPFLVAPAVLVTTTYLAMKFGLVHYPAFYVPSSIPSVISVVLATLDWRAVILILVNIGLATAIYAPFVRILERAELAKLARETAEIDSPELETAETSA